MEISRNYEIYATFAKFIENMLIFKNHCNLRIFLETCGNSWGFHGFFQRIVEILEIYVNLWKKMQFLEIYGNL